MRILAIDMGTGTQDILLYDSTKPVENSAKMVLPSATEIAARRVRRATAARRPLVLTGVVAGGGPVSWAVEAHLAAGGRVFATEGAALTFDDDLERVREMGIVLVAEDEAASIDGVSVVLRDLDLDAIRTALAAFEEPGDFDGIALGCLDHGAAPPGVSDRLFRFEHLRRVVEGRNDLLAFASKGEDLPAYLTRARAMAGSAQGAAPVSFMDTGPAAALGALHDERVAAAGEQLVLNLGNMHLLGFHLRGRAIASLFEHHTGEVTAGQIETFAGRLAEGTLEHREIFESKGHGAYHAERSLVSGRPGVVAVTGPQRGKIAASSLRPYFAAPFGDMMISGCFGLLRGFAEVYPEAREAVEAQLGPLPVIDPEVRVLLERAARWRLELESLLAVVPADHWERIAPGDAWRARTHLAHLATIDAPMTAIFEAAVAGARALVPFGATTMDELESARQDLLASLDGHTEPAMLAMLGPRRAAAMDALSRLSSRQLDLPVWFPAADAWSRPAAISLRAYAATWASHDGEHAAAIRAAIATAPSPAAMAVAARLRRR